LLLAAWYNLQSYLKLMIFFAVISPLIEPNGLINSKTNNMNADCALIFYLTAGHFGPVKVQGIIQLHKPHDEGVLER